MLGHLFIPLFGAGHYEQPDFDPSLLRTLIVRAESRDLGTFTWAALQAAYPNGGAALAALPAGTVAWVVESTWQGRVIPNAANAYWSMADRTSVILNTALVSGTTSGADQIVFSQLLPAGLLRACRAFTARYALAKSGTTDAVTSSAIKLGITGTVADANIVALPNMAAGNRTLAGEQSWWVSSATQLTRWGPQNNNGWGGSGSGVAITTFTISNLDANALYMSISVDMTGTTDTPQVQAFELELVP